MVQEGVTFPLLKGWVSMFRKSVNKRQSARKFNRGSRKSRRENRSIMRGGWRL